jgi:hypothetical protein
MTKYVVTYDEEMDTISSSYVATSTIVISGPDLQYMIDHNSIAIKLMVELKS